MKKTLQHKERMDSKKVWIIDIISLLLGFAGALLAYVSSSYVKEVLGTDNVGVVYLIAYSIILVTLLNLHKIIRIFGKSFVLQMAFLFKILSIVGLIISPISIWGLFFFIAYIIGGSIIWASLDGILESFSDDKNSGRIRGMHLAISNAGFLVGPLLSIQLLEKFNFTGVFILSLLTHFVVFSFLIVFIRGTNHKFKEKEGAWELVKKVFKRKNVRKVYYLSFALEFFYALMVIYTPLYLLEKGFTWEQLGVAFTIMLVPFVLIQYPIGVFADKRMGEKELLFLAFFLMGTSTLMFYFIDSPDIMIWTTVLLLTRIGAALVETLRESYFYKRIDGDNVDLIDFFKTAKPVAYIIAMISSALVLTFFSIQAIFILVVVISFSALWPTFRLIDNKSEMELKNGS